MGFSQKIIALNLRSRVFSMYNPIILERSAEKFTLWDDCLSFPETLVKIARNQVIKVEYDDENGKKTIWDVKERSISELLQHEIDHLEGITAFDRIEGRNCVLHRDNYAKAKDFYHS